MPQRRRRRGGANRNFGKGSRRSKGKGKGKDSGKTRHVRVSARAPARGLDYQSLGAQLYEHIRHNGTLPFDEAVEILGISPDDVFLATYTQEGLRHSPMDDAIYLYEEP